MKLSIHEFLRYLVKAKYDASKWPRLDLMRIIWGNWCFDDDGAHWISDFGLECFKATECLDLELYRLFHGGDVLQ